MNSIIDRFIQEHADRTLPLVVGLSGGADSLCLFYLLLESFPHLIIAHVHHGQRKESDVEEVAIRALAEKHGVPFHVKRLKLQEISEEVMRNERLRFFQEVVRETGAQAVVLGHHRKDQAETVLKRVLEGAWMRGGMEEVSEFQGLKIWRPLLTVPKEKLIKFLEERSIPWFEDHTNKSEEFLRGRMRETIFPFLTESFGKEIEPPLSRMAHEVSRVMGYLDEENRSLHQKKIEGDIGVCYDWSEEELHPARWWHLVKTVCPEFSYKEVEIAAGSLAAKKGNIAVGKYFIDRGMLFSVPASKVSWTGEISEEKDVKTTTWREAIRGKSSVFHIEGLTFAEPDPGAMYGTKTLREWWSEHKIPSIMRPLLPVLVKNGETVHEFLTGKLHPLYRGQVERFFCCYDSVLKVQRG